MARAIDAIDWSDPEGRVQQLRRFVALLQRRRQWGRALGAGLRALLLLAVPAIVLVWWRAEWAVVTVFTLVGSVVATAVTALPGPGWRGLNDLGSALSPRELALLRDELVTWIEVEPWVGEPGGGPARRSSGMASWLAHDLGLRLGPVQAPVLRAATRPSLGRWRWLLPIVALLVFLWLLSAWLQPPWAGALGGGAGAGSGRGSGSGRGAGAGGDGAESDPDGPAAQAGASPGEQSPEPPPPPSPAPPSREEPETSAAERDAPAPLLDLPDDQRFVVPEFVGDGPTRRARMQAAEVAEQAGTAGSQARRATESPARSLPPPAAVQEEFERAAERALQSRHVPAAEQPMVRRFFDRLREVARDG